MFRGFLGRVFAQRWALKRAEVEALKSVLHEGAVNIQRAYRGRLGRVEATEVTAVDVAFPRQEEGAATCLLTISIPFSRFGRLQALLVLAGFFLLEALLFVRSRCGYLCLCFWSLCLGSREEGVAVAR